MYRQHQQRVLGYALRRAPVETAKDAVADAFLAAWRRFDELPEDAPPWLVEATRRTLANQRRSLARQAQVADRLALERHGAVEEDGDVDVSVATALRRLSPDDRGTRPRRLGRPHSRAGRPAGRLFSDRLPRPSPPAAEAFRAPARSEGARRAAAERIAADPGEAL